MRFEAVKGQERALALLTRALTTGRLPTAWLFTGPSGCGRKKAALALAASLGCEAGPLACGECPACRLALAGTHPDIHLIRRREGKKEIVVEQMREEVLAKAYLQPFAGRASTFIIEGAEEMNATVANVFLKTLEEPPPSSRFVLIAPSREALLPTVASRCQEVGFRPLGPALVESLLRERGVEGELAARASLLARGSMERAVELAEEGTLSRMEEELAAVLSLAGAHPAAALALAERWGKDRRETQERLELLAEWMRDLMLLAAGGPEEETVHRALLPQLRAAAAGADPHRLAWNLEAVENTREEIEGNANVELALDRLFMVLGGSARGELEPWTT